MHTLTFKNTTLFLDGPAVMGIVNVTPDSFFADSRCPDPQRALQRAQSMEAQGADMIDVGGESTRPGSRPVTLEQELARVVPTIAHLSRRLSIPISVDTSQPQVMRQAVAAGAQMINDVRALTQPGALQAAAELGVPVCLMHRGGEGVQAIRDYLSECVTACVAAGIRREDIIVDPGFGTGSFGKDTDCNLRLLKALSELRTLNLPILVGMDRKTFIGDVLQKPVAERGAGSLAAHVIAALHGAQIFRVYDVAATRDALAVVHAYRHACGLLETPATAVPTA